MRSERFVGIVQKEVGGEGRGEEDGGITKTRPALLVVAALRNFTEGYPAPCIGCPVVALYLFAFLSPRFHICCF